MPTPEQLAAEADKLLQIEQDAADDATGALRARLAELLADLTAGWIRLYGSVTARADDRVGTLLRDILDRLRRALGLAVPVARTAIIAGSVLAASHGITVSLDTFPDDLEPKLVTVRSVADTGHELSVARIVADGRQRAAALLVPEYATTLSKALTGLGAGGDRTAAELERLARTAANEAASTAARKLADENGTGLLWVAERDACVHCLAYAGVYAEHGKPFPTDLTYGEKPLNQPDDLLHGPPLHPNCRCTIRPWLPEWDADLPAALMREARRSVALGFRLPSESTPARLRAADRLLSGTPALPKTVVARARKAVKQGTFADRRR